MVPGNRRFSLQSKVFIVLQPTEIDVYIYIHSLKLTASSHLKIGRLTQKETRKYSKHPFSGVSTHS